MRRSRSRYAQSSGSESTICWKVSARAIAAQQYPRTVAAIDQLSSEHATLVDGCGLVDRSERGKLALTGGGAAEFLNGQVTNDVAALAPGEGCYAAFLTHKGKMLGDLRVLRAGDELLLDTERVALQALFDMIRDRKSTRLNS